LFDLDTAVAANADGAPDCTVNPEIHKSGTTFVFQPVGCQPGSDCNALRALVLAFANTAPIPDVSMLYTCNVVIATNASQGVHALTRVGLVASDPKGVRVPVIGTDGKILVTGEVIESPTPTPASSHPTSTPTPAMIPGTATSTPTPEGECVRGQCSGVGVFMSQFQCCQIAQQSASPLVVFWCSTDKVDPTTGTCVACSDPCN